MRRLVLVVPATALLLATFPLSAASPPRRPRRRFFRSACGSMMTEGSFHYNSTASIAGKVALSLSTDSSLTYGNQTQKLDGGTETTRLIGKNLYMYADAKAYAQDFGRRKDHLGQRVGPGALDEQELRQHFVDAILVKSVMQQLVDIGSAKGSGHRPPLTARPRLELRGDAGASGTETIYVSTDGAVPAHWPLGCQQPKRDTRSATSSCFRSGARSSPSQSPLDVTW